jgi:hypothetical protein
MEGQRTRPGPVPAAAIPPVFCGREGRRIAGLGAIGVPAKALRAGDSPALFTLP